MFLELNRNRRGGDISTNTMLQLRAETPRPKSEMDDVQDRPPSSPILPSSSAKSRGKSKSRGYETATEDEDVEDEIERGLREIDEDLEQPYEEAGPSTSKGKGSGKRSRVEDPPKKTSREASKKRKVQAVQPLTGLFEYYLTIFNVK